jgi:hypothetical protein
MAWPRGMLNLCCRNVRDLPGDFQSHSAAAPASLSMPPPSSTNTHNKRKRHDTCGDIIDTESPKVCSINNVLGLSVSGCLSLSCNGVYMVDGMRNGRPYFYRYSKGKPSPNSNGSCCYISGEWRLSLNNSAEFYCVTSDAYFPPHEGWGIITQALPSYNNTEEHPKVITKCTRQFRFGDQVKSLTDWASGKRRVSKGQVGTITGSFESIHQSTGRPALKFRVDYPSIKGLGTWPEQMSYYDEICPGKSILMCSELRAWQQWADAQSKCLDNNPVAETLVKAKLLDEDGSTL